MLLHVGSVPSLMVSSADSAREIMQTHDLEFASKPTIQIYKKLYYDSKEISIAPYGEYWRQAKKTIILHYLSNKMVQTFSAIRDEEIAVTVREIEKFSVCGKVVNLSDLLFEHSNGVSCRATFGRKYNNGESGKKFKKVSKDLLEVLTRFYFVDSIPWLGWIDQISGANRKVEKVAKNIDEFLEVALEERLAKMHHEAGEGVEPFIDALLMIHKDGFNGFSFDRDAVKALLMDAYLAGTDTTSSVLEWVMAELLVHLHTLKKLKAVIMETTRLHPPVPVPPARVATQDVKIMGFDIAKGTRVYVNVWAIGRDPKVWDKPDEFVPERFVTGSVDFVKHDFKFIPFGAGRSGCPGRVFGMAVVENLLVNLVCKFDWAMSDFLKEEGVNMDETIGLASHKKIPLLAFASPFSF